MTSPAEDPAPSPAAGGGTMGWRERVQTAVVGRMPPGGRARAVAIAARDTVRDVRGAAQAVRSHWTAADVAELPAPPYPVWLAAHRADRAELAARADGPTRWPTGTTSWWWSSPGTARWPRPCRASTRSPCPAGGRWSGARRTRSTSGWPSWAPVTRRRRPHAGWRPRTGHDARGAGGGPARPRLRLRGGAGRPPRAPGRPRDMGRRRRRRAPAPRSALPAVVVARAAAAEDYVGRAFAMRASIVPRPAGSARPRTPARTGTSCCGPICPPTRVRRVPRVLSSVPARVAVPAGGGGGRGAGAPGPHGPARSRRARPRRRRARGLASPRAGRRVTVVVPTRHNRAMLGPACRPWRRATTRRSTSSSSTTGSGRRRTSSWYAELDPVSTWTCCGGTAVQLLRRQQRRAPRAPTPRCSSSSTTTPSSSTRSWLRELVGWAMQPDIGVVGLQLLDPAGAIQHEGVIVGMSGFADHVFAGHAAGQQLHLRSDRPGPRTCWP